MSIKHYQGKDYYHLFSCNLHIFNYLGVNVVFVYRAIQDTFENLPVYLNMILLLFL